MSRAPDLKVPRAAAFPDTNRIRVAAGVLLDKAGRVLLAERKNDSTLAGCWEFPGGKLEPGETAEAALCRELDEELGIAVTDVSALLTLDHDYSDRRVCLEFFIVERWLGRPRAVNGQNLRWVAMEDLDPGELLPADAPVIDALRGLSRR